MLYKIRMTNSVVNVVHFLVSQMVPTSFVDDEPKLGVLIIASQYPGVNQGMALHRMLGTSCNCIVVYVLHGIALHCIV